MGLFSKKPKELCPICGREMGFFSSTEVKGGKVCDKCYKAYGMTASGDILSLDEIKAAHDDQMKAMADIKAKFGDYSGILKVDKVETNQFKATDIGIKKAKELSGLFCFRGYVIDGTIAREGKFEGYHGDKKIALEMVDIYKGEGVMSEEIAGALGKFKTAEASEYVDIFVANPDDLAEGDYIAAK